MVAMLGLSVHPGPQCCSHSVITYDCPVLPTYWVPSEHLLQMYQNWIKKKKKKEEERKRKEEEGKEKRKRKKRRKKKRDERIVMAWRFTCRMS